MFAGPSNGSLEAADVMKQCWSESPDARPDFDDIAHRFKDFNKGRCADHPIVILSCLSSRHSTICVTGARKCVRAEGERG